MLNQERRQLLTSLSGFYQRPVAKASIELFLSIGAVLFFAIFAIKPTLITMSDLIKEIDDKKALDHSLAQKIAALSSAQSEYIKLESQLPKLDLAIPTNPDLVHTLKIVEKIASDQKIILTNLNITDVPKEVPLNTEFSKLQRQNLTFTVGVSGEFSAIRAFVAQLLDSQRSFVVDKIVFAITDVRGLKRLEANVTITAPYYGLKP